MTPILLATVLSLAAYAATSTPAAPESPAAAAAPSGLLAAIQAGEARVVARGTGSTAGDALQLQVINQSGSRRVWALPIAVRAESANPNHSDMLIRRLKGRTVDASRYESAEMIELDPGQSASYVVEAYSLEFHKQTPSPTTPMELKPPLPYWRRLLSEADSAQPSTRALQAAVWMLSDNIGREEFDKSFPLSAAEYALALGLAGAARAEAAPPDTTPGEEPLSVVSPTPRPSGDWPLAPGIAINELPAPAGAETESGPLLSLQSGGVRIAIVDGKARLEIPIVYEWNAPGPERPRHYVACMRYITGKAATDAAASGLRFDGDSGAYEAIVEQSALKESGLMVYAVFKDLTVAADQLALNALFDDPAKGEALRISPLLRFAVDWERRAVRALEPADSLFGGLKALEPDDFTTTTQSADSPSTATVSPIDEPPPETPEQLTILERPAALERIAASPTATPAAAPPAASSAAPIEIDLPLKRGGALRGRLLGVENGRLRLELNGHPFEYEAAGLRHSPAQLLDEARKANREGRFHSALQYAAVAALLLTDPEDRAEAETIVEQTHARRQR